MNVDGFTHYQILRVSPDAEVTEIKAAVRKLSREWHPDLHNNSAESVAMMARINVAAEVLTNLEKRAAYDEELTGAGEEESITDPDSYEDNWGEEEKWEQTGSNSAEPQEKNQPPLVEDIILDEEVIETESTPGGASPHPQQSSTSPRPQGKITATRVRTPAPLIYATALIPFFLLVGFVVATSALPYLWSTGVVAFIAVTAVVLMGKVGKTEYGGTRNTLTILVAMGALFIAFGHMQVLVSPYIHYIRVLLVGAVTGYIFGTGHKFISSLNQSIKPSILKKDLMMFGPPSEHGHDQFTDDILVSCMNEPSMHAARLIRTDNPKNPYTRALILGDKAVLVRPVSIRVVHGRVYWRNPALMMHPMGQQLPVTVLTLPTTDFNQYMQKNTLKIDVKELLVVFGGEGAVLIPTPDKAGPQVIPANALADAVREHLVGDFPQVNFVDQENFLAIYKSVFFTDHS